MHNFVKTKIEDSLLLCYIIAQVLHNLASRSSMKKKILVYSLLLALFAEAAVIAYSVLFPAPQKRVVEQAIPQEKAPLPQEVKKEEPKKAETVIASGVVTQGADSVAVEITTDDPSSPVIQKFKISQHDGLLSLPLEKPNSFNVEFPESLAKKKDISPPVFHGLSEAAAAGPSTVTLKWEAAKDNTTPSEKISYLIYEAPEAGKEDTSHPVRSITGHTSFRVNGLKDGAVYYFVARAKDEQGNIDNNTKEVKVATPLYPPSGISIATVTDKEAMISWKASPRAKGFKVERREANAKEYREVSSVATTSYKDTGPFKSTNYYYRIIAYNDFSTSAYSEEVFASLVFPIVVVNKNRFGCSYPSIAVDPKTGFPRISYYDGAKGTLNLASFNGVSWSIEVVDEQGDIGWDTALAIDKKTGYPRIGYYDGMHKAFKYAAFDGSKWSIQKAVEVVNGGWGTFLILDPWSGNPQLSYSDFGSREVKLASFDGNAWSVKAVDKGRNDGWSNALALDQKNRRIYIGYYGDDKTLKLASFDGNGWHISFVDGNIDAELGASLAVNPQSGYPYISYYSSDHILRLAYYTGSAWRIKEIDKGSGKNKGWDNVLAFNPATGYPVISYYASDDKLKLASFNGSSWDIKTVADYSGGYLSMDINPADGRIFLSYYDRSTWELKCYAPARKVW